jgi:WXG100 family type VII secretion target
MVVRVTPDDLRSVSGNLSSGAGSIQEQLTQMRNQVQALVDGQWEGAASGSFRDLYDKWNASAANLHEALMGISSLLHDTGDVYETTDQELADRFKQ